MTLLDDLHRLMAEGRLGHAYILNGDPGGEGLRMAEEVALLALGHGSSLPEAQLRHRIQGRLHPDVHWVEPRGKLRQIKVEDVSGALKQIYEKSFEGGWKVVVFLGAERMNPSSGNKLLKSLEEPPDKTLLLLVTGSPERLLSTLRSRCQWLTLPRHSQAEPGWLKPLLGLLANGPPRSLRGRLDRAAAFRDFFDLAAKQEVEQEQGEDEENLEEDVVNARETAARRRLQRDVLAAVETWYRDVLVCKTAGEGAPLQYPDLVDILKEQADGLPLKSIRKLMENVQTASRELDGNLPIQVVLEGSVF
jgi:DNA polymerase-3 subunit delta'